MTRVLSFLFGAAPFFFGVIRYAQTGTDLRMLWMAAASAIGALAVRSIAKAGNLAAWAALTLVVSTAFAAATGFLLGATAGPGAAMVAFVFGFCWAVSFALMSYSRSQPV